MKKKFTHILLALVFITGTAVKAQTDQKNANRVDSLLSIFTKKNMFCGSVLIAKNGKVLLNKGYGMANYSYDIPNSPTTKFKLASVSKQFTAMAIMMLQEKGRLSTDDKLSKFWPEYKFGEKITVHNLLTHTSGIANLTNLPVFDSINEQPHTLIELMGYFKELPLEFEPGEKFKYSNSGYILLTYIIEKASGKNYGDFMKENIFDPLGMKNSGLYPETGILKNEAIGYHAEEQGLEKAPYINMTIPCGAGALYSTTEDMYTWDRALTTEKLVKKSTIDKIFTAYKDGYGYGWFIDNYNDHPWIFHNGGIEGFSTTISRFPKEDMTIIMLRNVDNYTVLPSARIARQIMYGDKFELPVERKIANVNPSIYKNLCGEFELGPGFVLTISSTEENKIYCQATGQSKAEMYPESEYRYFFKVVDAQLEFSKDENGKVNQVTLHQNGAHMPGKKIN